jgi:hypothetical protein
MVGPSRRRVASGLFKEEDSLTHVAPERGPVGDTLVELISPVVRLTI